jgi:hypothetical protein
LERRELQVEVAQDVDTHDRINLDLISVSRLKPLGTPGSSVLPRSSAESDCMRRRSTWPDCACAERFAQAEGQSNLKPLSVIPHPSPATCEAGWAQKDTWGR